MLVPGATPALVFTDLYVSTWYYTCLNIYSPHYVSTWYYTCLIIYWSLC